MLKLPRTRKAVLDSGATLLYQRNPFSPTVAFGLYFKRGSRDEILSERGLTHLLEHMVFRGTKRRSPLEIAFTLEAIGGQWDAFTSKESTCFYGKILEDNFETLVDIFADIVLNPSIPDNAFRLERRIVLEEIRSIKDSPEDATHEHFFEALFPGHPLGFPITGYESDLSRYKRQDLARFHKKVYTADRALLGLVGNVPFGRVVSLLNDRFAFARRSGGGYRRARPGAGRRISTRTRSSWKQMHVCIGTATGPVSDRDRYALGLVAGILGGGVTSRLFQSMREKNGLVYSVYSQTSFWRDTGAFWAFFSVDPKNLAPALKIFQHELEGLRRGEISDEEIESVKSQYKGSFLFGMENIESRLFHIFKSEFYHGRYISPAEVVRSIERIDRRILAETAERYLADDRFTYVSQGPVSIRGMIPRSKRRSPGIRSSSRAGRRRL